MEQKTLSLIRDPILNDSPHVDVTHVNLPSNSRHFECTKSNFVQFCYYNTVGS